MSEASVLGKLNFAMNAVESTEKPAASTEFDLDYYGWRVVLAACFGVMAAGIFPLARADSFPVGCLAAALLGIGAGGEAAITPYLLRRYFGLRAFSTLYGLTCTFYAAAGAIGPVILGRAFDLTGSYAALLVLLAGALGVAAAANLLLPRYSGSLVDDLS